MVKAASICVLASGGLDSDVLLADLGRRARAVYPVYIRQGLRWEDAELHWLRRFLKALSLSSLRPLQVFSLPMRDLYGTHWSLGRGPVPGMRTRDASVFLPGRNLALLVKTAVFCAAHRIPRIALATLEGNPFPDATDSFFSALSRTLSRGLASTLRIEVPFRHVSKADLVRRGAAWPLQLSFSCLAPAGKLHCGRCNKCGERRRAFRTAGVVDPTVYAHVPV